jgi:hypothetical protein
VRNVLLLSLIAASMGAVVSAQVVNTPRSFSGLQAAIPQATSPRGALELHVMWAAAPATRLANGGRTFTLVQHRAVPGAIRNERRPEIGPHHLVIVAVDADGRERDWRLIQNPRIARVEMPGDDGQLTGGVFETDKADLVFASPDLPGLRTFRIHQPRWNGAEFVLDLIGEIDLSVRP